MIRLRDSLLMELAAQEKALRIFRRMGMSAVTPSIIQSAMGFGLRIPYTPNAAVHSYIQGFMLWQQLQVAPFSLAIAAE